MQYHQQPTQLIGHPPGAPPTGPVHHFVLLHAPAHPGHAPWAWYAAPDRHHPYAYHGSPSAPQFSHHQLLSAPVLVSKKPSTQVAYRPSTKASHHAVAAAAAPKSPPQSPPATSRTTLRAPSLGVSPTPTRASLPPPPPTTTTPAITPRPTPPTPPTPANTTATPTSTSGPPKCPHGRRRTQCTRCFDLGIGGGSICEHRRRKGVCPVCRGAKGSLRRGRPPVAVAVAAAAAAAAMAAVVTVAPPTTTVKGGNPFSLEALLGRRGDGCARDDAGVDVDVEMHNGVEGCGDAAAGNDDDDAGSRSPSLCAPSSSRGDSEGSATPEIHTPSLASTFPLPSTTTITTTTTTSASAPPGPPKCPHGRRRTQCTSCFDLGTGGGSICVHRRRKGVCPRCKGTVRRGRRRPLLAVSFGAREDRDTTAKAKASAFSIEALMGWGLPAVKHPAATGLHTASSSSLRVPIPTSLPLSPHGAGTTQAPHTLLPGRYLPAPPVAAHTPRLPALTGSPIALNGRYPPKTTTTTTTRTPPPTPPIVSPPLVAATATTPRTHSDNPSSAGCGRSNADPTRRPTAAATASNTSATTRTTTASRSGGPPKCPHGRRRTQCTRCYDLGTGGGSICVHRRRKGVCPVCRGLRAAAAQRRRGRPVAVVGDPAAASSTGSAIANPFSIEALLAPRRVAAAAAAAEAESSSAGDRAALAPPPVVVMEDAASLMASTRSFYRSDSAGDASGDASGEEST
ncbi:hypothetical protein DFJ73DRAFT_799514 [Zopfochytrium polystomum]|nr:hypothetical protein DFJ73DRAFT_799514 [Zopfochytrium polystomum]